MVMVALEEGFNPLLQRYHLTGFVFAPAEAFFSQSAIEAFDMRLFILLVRSSHTVAVTK